MRDISFALYLPDTDAQVQPHLPCSATYLCSHVATFELHVGRVLQLMSEDEDQELGVLARPRAHMRREDSG